MHSSNTQFSLFEAGTDRSGSLIDPLFFALQLDAGSAATALDLALRLRSQYGLKGKPQSPGLLHVTLHFMGYSPGDPREIVQRACKALQGFRAPPFEVCFDRVLSFRRKSRRPLVLVGGAALAPLLHFQQQLRSALLLAHLPDPEKLTFTPHITLLRDDREVPEQGIAPLCWKVRDFVLLRSLHGRGEHQVLARFPLDG
jgi:RNA 2',3'-cyclic 3'-phosphodiesterase